MERRVVREINGQELRNQDLTIMSDDGAMADDRLIWELVRMTPGSATPQKGIIPYAVSGAAVPGAGDGFSAAMHNSALVQGGTANGSVRVMPFRAVVGSTTLFATSPLEKLRGIRSGYCIGSSSMYSTVAISANATGNPRWVLVYAVVTPDADGDTVAVKTKDPTSGIVSSGSVVVNRVTTVVVTTADGVAAANPVRPTLPADGAGSYYIALAYLFIPTGFGAISQVHYYEIHEAATVLPISPATGAASMVPASEQWRIGGVVDVAQNASRNAANRTGAYLPSTMVGMESIFILLQLGLLPYSHADGAIVDSSRDWRQRYFRSTAFVTPGNTSTAAFASDRNGTGVVVRGGAVVGSLGIGVGTMITSGQSFVNDYPGGAVATCSGIAVGLQGQTVAATAETGFVTNLGPVADYVLIYVDSTTGYLKVKLSITNGCQVAIWLDATAQYSNSNSF